MWPVENSEDMLKIDKNLMTTKRGSCVHFRYCSTLIIILFFDIFSSLRSTKEVTTENMSLVAGLFTFQVSEVSSDANNRNMIRNKAKISTRKHNSDDAVYVLL